MPNDKRETSRLSPSFTEFHAAYAGTWADKEKLGWTREKYETTGFWSDVESATREYAPELFQ